MAKNILLNAVTAAGTGTLNFDDNFHSFEVAFITSSDYVQGTGFWAIEFSDNSTYTGTWNQLLNSQSVQAPAANSFVVYEIFGPLVAPAFRVRLNPPQTAGTLSVILYSN